MLDALNKDWDESKHPRVPGGSSEGGQFGSGGGGSDSEDDGGGGRGEHPGKGYSKGAYVDKHGVIQTTSVYDAQRALHENRKVELDQPRKVSVLIQKLGEVTKKMIDKGEAAPTFNLCNVSVKGTSLFCADTKGIPRVKMPQLDKQQTKDFRQYLKDKGYKVEKEKVFASHLRATQNEINGAKVAATAEKLADEGGDIGKRLIVSKDDYILDGHHHWAAKVGLDAANNELHDDTKVRVSRVNISITKLLEEAEKFTGGKGHKDVGEKSFNIGEVFLDWDESLHPRDEAGRFGFGGGGASDEGAGYEFVSPNVGALDFNGAVKELGSVRQGVLQDASKDINNELEISATHFDVVGAWQDGAENSVMDVSTGAAWDKLKLSGAMKGWVADQKSVLIFQQRDQGDGVLAQFEAQGNLNEIHDNLLADGVTNHTLVPTATGATVYVADLDNSQTAAVKKAATRYGPKNKIEVHFGHGEFIGTDNYEGSDRDQRDRARSVYEADIERSPVQGSKEIWQRVRDRWGKALAESDTAKSARIIYVRSNLLKAHHAIVSMEAEGFELIPYDGEHIPGTELIDTREWEGERRAAPKTLYVSRTLHNYDAVIAWAKSQGFEKTIVAADMHVTVAFSRAPVDWDKLEENHTKLFVRAGGPRSVERLGQNGEAVVLRFESETLTERWRQFMQAGASWDYEDYKPHVTISFDAPNINVDEIDPYEGELIFGPEVFAELNEDWKDTVVERDVDYIQDPTTGHLMGSHGHGGDADKESGGGEKGDFYKPSPEAMAVGGDEWNQATAERLEKEFVEAAPTLDKIVSDAVSEKAEVDIGGGPDPDDAPMVPESWDMVSGDDQEQVETDWKEANQSAYYDSEVENWQENQATDDAGTELAYSFEHGSNEQWAKDSIAHYRTVSEEAGRPIPFTDKQLLQALVVKYDNTGYNDIQKGLEIEIDDSKLGEPIGFDTSPSFPGIEPEDPTKRLTEDMRKGLLTDLGAAFESEAENVRDHLEAPDYLSDSASEMLEQSWGEMSDKEKFAWVESNTDIVSDAQKEYDEYFGDSQPGGETGAVQEPANYDPLAKTENSISYKRTQVVARHLSVERAAQIMVGRGLYKDIEKARFDAKQLDSSLWEGWKGSSHGSAGQLLQKATADELGGRLNPNMVELSPAQIEMQAEERAVNAPEGKAYDAVKAYVRGKWETTQYLLKKAGIDTVNVYRAVNMTDAAPPSINEFTNPTGPAEGQRTTIFSVRTQKTFDTKEQADKHAASEKEKNPDANSSVFESHQRFISEVNYRFKQRDDAEKFMDKYQKDPDNPQQHSEQVKEVSPGTGNIIGHYDRLPDIHINRNGAASTTTDRSVANKWDGTTGRVVLRASVPRTAVISVPAYGINVHGEHEVVVAGTAWKGWDAWYGRAPPFENVKVGHQIVGHPKAA